MKRKKRTIIILILAVISAIVAGIIGILYYVSIYHWSFASIALTIRNIITCFAFVPSLSVTDVFAWLKGTDCQEFLGTGQMYNFVNRFLIHVYAGIILIAPVCTASALYLFIARIFRQIKWKVVSLFWKKPKEKILVIGSGKAAADLILSEKKMSPDREIYYVSADPKTVDEEVDLMKRKIRFCEIDLINCPDKDFLQFMKNYRLDSMNAIIICEDSDAADFSIYIRLMKLGYGQLSKHNLICCRCEDTAMMNLIKDYYDDNKDRCIPPKLFSIAKMRVASIMERQPLPVCCDGTDLSLLVVGFGMTGQTMVRNMINLGVSAAQSKLTIHVVDVDMDTKENMFLRHFSSEYFSITDHCCRIGSDKADGVLEILFHKMDVRSRDFENLLKDSCIQYASVCMENVDYCLDCMQTIENYITRYDREQLPIVVSLLSDPEITVYLNHDTKRFKNVFFIGASAYYNIDQILASSVEEKARKFHQIYQNISVVTLKEYQDMLDKCEEHQSKPWEDMFFYKQESSRMLSRHQPVKEKILEYLKEKDRSFSMEQYFGKEGTILQKNGATYVFEGSPENLVKKLNAVPALKELGMMEHRRWCYCQAAEGWSYAPLKSESRKQTPYLVPWDQLCAENPEMCIYDYMAYFI